ncbi:MAG TPA: type II secretion system F family protein [Candidatus Nanoarchaeia archaeon]|nr:type II secretion system F family protein [Candidatus Nanoarchaeia archaeon]
MKLQGEMFEGVGKAFIFEKIRPKLKKYLRKAGITEVPYSQIGLFFWLSILPVAYFFIFGLWGPIIEQIQNPVLRFLLAFAAWSAIHTAVLAGLVAVVYGYLDLRIFNRTAKMEAVMPDFLRFVSENLKGGMPFEKSLWGAIKPEFGILSQEVRLAAKKVMTGADVDEAITEFTNKYYSPMLKRSFNLILEGMKGGGKVADVIDRVIETLEETKELKQEMAATNLTYVIFVSVIVIIVAPGLFTLSFQFLSILQGLGERVSTTGATQQAASLPISFSKVTLEPEQFKAFSRYALMIISTFAGMIVSMINNGSIKGGIKFVPFLFISSQVVYFVSMRISYTLFKGLFSGF